MRALVRWIIGPVRSAGFHALALSVSRIRRLYGDRFDYLVCHNQLSSAQVERLGSLEVPLHEQSPDDFPLTPIPWDESNMVGPLPRQPTRNCWKLHPPRLRIDAHEIILDNDLILASPLSELEAFLKGSHVLTTEGLKRSYGRLDHAIRPNLSINTGLLGLPPGFDLGTRLRLDLLKGGWQDYFDEQAIISEAIQEGVVLVPRFRICYGEQLEWTRPLHHFIGINYLDDHPLWKRYLARRV